MKRITATALLVTLAVAAVAAVPPGHRSTAGTLAAPESSSPVYFPMLLQDGRPEVLPTGAARTPVPTLGTPRPTSTPATATPLPTPESQRGEVVFQLATFGGLSFDMMLGGSIPSQTPRFTLYEDGFYIRIVEGYDPDVEGYAVERVEGTLGDSERTELVRRLVEDVDFFDLPARPPGMICATDLPMDHLYLWADDREHRVAIYGLTSFTTGPWSCPTPWPLDERLVTLVEIVDDFQAPLTEDEAPLDFDRITLVATDRDDWGGDDPVPVWPFSPEIRLADMPADAWWRAMQVEGEVAREIVQSIEEYSIHSSNVARFADDGVNFVVGARIEFAGWDAYR